MQVYMYLDYIMLTQIKASNWRVKWNLREIHLVTQWKSGCIYRTKSIGMISCTDDYASWLRSKSKNVIVGPVSTSVSKLLT
jgi:6-phosphogluconate dehydrogenase